MNLSKITYNSKHYFNYNVESNVAGIPSSILDAATFNQFYSDKLKELNIQCEIELKSLTNTYPAGEVSTFDKQEAEARAYLSDSNAATPLLDALAAGRGIDKAELINRVIAKADAFSVTSGAIIGKRQKLEDALNELSRETHSIDDIAAITW